MESKNKLTEKMLDAFEAYLRSEEKSCITVKKYMRDVKRFCAFLGMKSVSKQAVVEYKKHLGEQYAVSGANSMLAALNSLFHFLGMDEMCVKQFKLQKKAYCEERRELTREEYFRLVQTAERAENERLSLIIQTICSTGIRVSELRCITAEAVKRGEAIVRCKGKTRPVFITASLKIKLLTYMKKKKIRSGPIFITQNGNPMNRSNIWREMKALCKAAGVMPEKVFPHNLRHLFARTFYAMEKDIVKLADILGHSNVNTTRIYTVTSSREHKRRLEKMRLIL